MERKLPVFVLCAYAVFSGALDAAQCLAARTNQEQSKQQPTSFARSKSCSDLHDFDEADTDSDTDIDPDSDDTIADIEVSAQRHVSEEERVEKETKAIAAAQQQKATEQQKNEPLYKNFGRRSDWVNQRYASAHRAALYEQ